VSIPEQHRELHDRLAVALLRRVEATLQLPYMPPEVVIEPLFVDDRIVIGGRQCDSLDLIEALVALEQDLGVLLLDRVELTGAGTLEGIAGLFIAKADRVAVERFCERWEAAGQYRP
jgi:hypothetical protein